MNRIVTTSEVQQKIGQITKSIDVETYIVTSHGIVPMQTFDISGCNAIMSTNLILYDESFTCIYCNMLKSFKVLFLVGFLLLMSACSQGSAQVSLDEGDARLLVENTLLSLEQYPNSDYEQYFSEFLLSTVDLDEVLPMMIEKWNLHDPIDVTVTDLENGVAEEIDGRVAKVLGTFQCEDADHLSDFDFTFLYDQENETWGIVDFKFEEC